MCMAQRKLSKAPRFERMFKIMEYLKRNTDRDHPTTQQKMRNDSISEYIGHKETFNRLIKDMAFSMNSSGDEILPVKDWKIVFDDFKNEYDLDNYNPNDDIDEDDSNLSMHIRNLYYNRTFSYDEIDRIIEGILSSKTLDTKSAKDLIEKIENTLTTKFYKKVSRNICKVHEPNLMDRETLRDNLLTIQEAIDNKKKITFMFNGYSCEKDLIPIRENKDIVSPYYIVANSGKYYLLACKEIKTADKTIKNMSIWRIDLMTEIEIPNFDRETGEGGYDVLPKREVENLPIEWDDNFQLEHLNMSFDKPVDITLKITTLNDRKGADYTFLHDWFGDNFRVVTDKKDIVTVRCSPYAMTHWALQYSDRVEVLEPQELRNEIVKKIKALSEKYKINL